MKKEQVGGLDFFKGDYCKEIEKKIKNFLNSNNEIGSGHNRKQRIMGDVIEDAVCEKMKDFFPEGSIKTCIKSKEAKAMGDVVLEDYKNNVLLVDVKTRNKNKKFNMPNLTSVRKIWDLYKEDNKYFVILLIEYEEKEGKTIYSNVRLSPIEWLNWECLGIGALGWGQIQIKNAREVKIDSSQTRDSWLAIFRNKVIKFYEDEKKKIDDERIKYFAGELNEAKKAK